jgi:hypothetical protein
MAVEADTVVKRYCPGGMVVVFMVVFVFVIVHD